MKCLRCGYCCKGSLVVIVDDPKLGVVEGNLKAISGEQCQHLKGNVPGLYRCAVHHYAWYSDTPCYAHGQKESNSKDPCRVGAHMMRTYTLKLQQGKKYEAPKKTKNTQIPKTTNRR